MKWEYFVQTLDMSGAGLAQGALTKLGTEGWELVTIVANVRKGGDWHAAVFKRPRLVS